MITTDIVNAWFRERIATGPIARDTDAYNQAFAALPDLVARLTPAPLAPPEPIVAEEPGAPEPSAEHDAA